jgi:hypothetical protein
LLARRLSQDVEVTNRLIQQALYFLGIGSRKHAFDQNWWTVKIDWETPAAQLIVKFLATLPQDRSVRLKLYGSAPLQLTLDRELMSGDVGLFSDDHLSNKH